MAGKRKFIEIELPIISKKVFLLGEAKEELIGKTVKLDLTRRLRGKSLEISFLIEKKGEDINIVPKKIELFGYYIRRMIKKSTDYIEDSFSASCKNAETIVKLFLIARKKVSRKVKNGLRNKAKEEIQDMIKDKSYESLFSDIISGRIQKNLSIKLKKIYPLALCEIRYFQVKSVKENSEIEEKKEKKIKKTEKKEEEITEEGTETESE